MIKITIWQNNYYYSYEEAKKVRAVLDAFGIQYTKEPEQEIYLAKIQFSCRAENVLRKLCNEHNIDYDSVSPKNIVDRFTKIDFLKVSGCGKAVLKSIEETFALYGYELK